MYLLSSSLFAGGDPAVSEEYFGEALKTYILPFWNAFYFFTTYANIDSWEDTEKLYDVSQVSHPLDRFLYAKVQDLISTVNE